MANTFLRGQTIARTALGLLQRAIVLPNIVTTMGGTDFRGQQNDTVTMRVPAVLQARDYEWRTRTAPIVVDDLTETAIAVRLDKHPYSAVPITDEQLTLDIADFGEQVLNVQIRAVAEKMEGYIASALDGATYRNTVDFVDGTDDPYRVAVRARKMLNQANVPLANRFLLLGSDVEEAFLTSDRFSKADFSGDAMASSALQDATLGRIAGFTAVTSNAIAPDAAYAFHQTAVVFANMAPVVPAGAPDGASESFQGLAMRWVRDYDTNYLRDRSVVSAFAGCTVVADGPDGPDVDTAPDVIRAVRINYTA